MSKEIIKNQVIKINGVKFVPEFDKNTHKPWK